MADSLAGIVLAAGAGNRLAPLTRLRPKALCPVANDLLVDRAIEAVGAVTAAVAVNVHHGRAQLEPHLAGRAHLSVEEPQALGTAGALGHLKRWIDGRPTLVTNADGWHEADLAAFTRGWDGARVRLLVVGEAPFGPGSEVVAALHPWSDVARLASHPSGLYEASWRPAAVAGHLDVAPHGGPFFDCGTPARYLEANLHASGAETVVGEGVTVEGVAQRSVLWPGTRVRRGERLVDAIRADERVTVLVRRASP